MIDGGDVCSRCGEWYHSGRHTVDHCLRYTERKLAVFKKRLEIAIDLIEKDKKEELKSRCDKIPF